MIPVTPPTPRTDGPVRLTRAILARPVLAVLLLLAAAGVMGAAVPAFNASEKPSFCRTCHEMRPYYDAWAKGDHGSVDCVECHVDRGTMERITHKAEASKELWVHLTGDPRFPTSDLRIPDARCLACHGGIRADGGPGFSHKAHARTAPCIVCHAGVGHRVTAAALKKAGVLAASESTPTLAAGRSAPATESVGHADVLCTTCHVLEKMKCSGCHSPAHKARGACETCHRPGARWAFTHPASEECSSCHPAPAKHYPVPCTTCHTSAVPFEQATYSHASDSCATCHGTPARHNAAATCASCHRRPGVSWAFSHPSSSSCASCHNAPSGHNRAVSCASCHPTPGSWGHRHPTSSSCASCHRPPAGHNAAATCASCHRSPGSWRFTHPSSGSCASCHRAPAGHYGSSCSTCHRTGSAWSAATFTHPRVEHGYRAFPCARCHPSGYSSHSCTTCHGPEGDDDDDR